MTTNQPQPLAGVRHDNESDNAVLACNEWLRMGPGRSLPALLNRFTQSYFESPPTLSEGTLKQWSSKHGWTDRATAFDAAWDQIRSEERAKELAYGLSLDFERVRKLKRLAELLEDQLYQRGPDGELISVWVPDVKVVGHGDDAETVDIERFNSAIFTQFRETLNDLAKETGGRAQRQEHTGKDGGAIVLQWPAPPALTGDDDER